MIAGSDRAAYDSRRALPASVADRLYSRLARELGAGSVLDVGCGSGAVSAELVRAGCRVILTDVVDWRTVRLPLVLADAAALPFGSGACTGVHMARVLHHVEDWRAVVAEAVRVLRVGGRLCLSLGDRPVADALRDLADRGIDLAERRGLEPAPAFDVPSGPAEVDEALAAVGAGLVDTFEIGTEVPVTPRDVLTGAIGNPFRWAADQDLAVVPAVVDELLAESGLDPDQPVLRDRTVCYRVYRRSKALVSILPV
jgi:SAM-dependent methyltransferase